MFRAFFLLFSFFSFLLSPAPIWAEETAAKSGRLKDGRAYRMDQDGYKLIDQLAEYEVSLTELKTQLFALEDELAEKNKSLLACNKVGPAGKNLREQDLLSDGGVKPASSVCAPVKPLSCTSEKQKIAGLERSKEELLVNLGVKKQELRIAQQSLSRAESCTASLDRSSTELGKLRQELAIGSAERKRLEVSLSKAELSKQKQGEDLGALLKESKRALELQSSKMLALSQELEKNKTDIKELALLRKELLDKRQQEAKNLAKIDGLKLRLDSLGSELSLKNQELSNALLLNEQSSKELEAKKRSLAVLEGELVKSRHERARLELVKNSASAKLLRAEQALAKKESSASEQLARMPQKRGSVRAPVLLKSQQISSNSSSEFLLIDRKLEQRRALLDELRKRGSAVQIKSSPLISDRGLSLDVLRSRARNKAELAFFKADLGQIERILDGDIALLKRLADL